ncbi:MAG: hypothetical protein JWO32_2601 [Bacteroidetes bacterium]|nr:hypothetical protein [Bacteroidota bacterium]
MPSVLILCAHRPGRSPSQRYRFEQYIPFLEKNGFIFSWSYLLNEKADRVFYSRGNTIAKFLILAKTFLQRFNDTRHFKKFDIVFIQRETMFLGTSFVEKKAALSGAKVIFDFDDSIWLADTSPGNRKWQWLKKPEKIFEAVKHANLVIAGNTYLANKSIPFNKNTIIIPTTIDTDFHIPKYNLRNKETLTLGWSGSISTIKHFELIVPVLIQLKEKYGNRINFKIIGDKNYKNDHLNIEALDWVEAAEVDQLNSFDIGLMPLPDDEWSKGKCGLKGLSYMACEVSTVMSNVGVNSEIIKNGINGFLINHPSEWLKVLSNLIENSQLRKDLGREGRKTVIEKYSVEANKNNYLKAFNTALHV